MARDPFITGYVAYSLELVEKSAKAAAEVDRYVTRGLEIVERSKNLLKRPRDPFQLARLMGDIATVEVEDRTESAPARAQGGKAGAKPRAAKLTREQRSQIAHAAAAARWKKH